MGAGCLVEHQRQIIITSSNKTMNAFHNAFDRGAIGFL